MFVNIPILMLFYLVYDYYFLNGSLLKLLLHKGIDCIIFGKRFINGCRFCLLNLTLYINNFFLIEPKCISIVDEKGFIIQKLGINQFSIFIENHYLNNSNNINNYHVFYDWDTLGNSEYNSFMLRFEKINEVNENFTMSNIKFLIPTINIKNSNEDIVKRFDLTNIFNNTNFYITNNILFDKIFVNWFLKSYYNYNLKDQLYDVTFIDHNMEQITINDNQGIFLDNNLYFILDN